jgi:hypothetical protein
VDFGKALPSTASGRPFDIEGIADQRRRVKMALSGECYDALPSSLSDLPQDLQWTNRSARAEFFGKLAPRDVLRSIRGIDFALGPGAIILLAPERTAGMNEQNLERDDAASASTRRWLREATHMLRDLNKPRMTIETTESSTQEGWRAQRLQARQGLRAVRVS